jgi:ATP-binding cassette subfamily B protein RaxB
LEYKGIQRLFNLLLHSSKVKENDAGSVHEDFHNFSEVVHGIYKNCIELMIEFAVIVVVIFLMLMINAILGLSIIVGTVLLLLGRLFVLKHFYQLINEKLLKGAGESSLFVNYIQSLQSIRMNAMFQGVASKWSQQYKGVVEKSISIEKFNVIVAIFDRGVWPIVNAFALIYSAYLLSTGSMTIGLVVAFMIYKDIFTLSFLEVSRLLNEIISLKSYCNRLEFLNSSSKRNSHEGFGFEQELETLELRSASFCVDEVAIIKPFTLKLFKNSKVSVSGPSGAGKTSLLRILSSIQPLATGELLINGKVVSESFQPNFVSRIGTVLQEDTILPGNIVENIVSFSNEIDSTRLSYVMAFAEIDPLIDPVFNVPDISKNKLMSTGQKTRVLLARALYKSPEILLLDELFANFDSALQQRVLQRLMGLDCLLVLVSHDKDLLRDFKIHVRVVDGVVALN